MAAGDTFRAAAAEQLEHVGRARRAPRSCGATRAAIPSSVIFDAVERAAARDADLVLADTAGRLHTKVNLMEELRKVRRVAEQGRRARSPRCCSCSTPPPARTASRRRSSSPKPSSVTGVVLTKLDGSAKGGIVFAIQTELGIPVKLVGLGETVDDLVAFDPDEFVDALFA